MAGTNWKENKVEVCHGRRMEKERQADLPGWEEGAEGEPPGHSYAHKQDFCLWSHADKYNTATFPVAYLGGVRSFARVKRGGDVCASAQVKVKYSTSM